MGSRKAARSDAALNRPAGASNFDRTAFKISVGRCWGLGGEVGQPCRARLGGAVVASSGFLQNHLHLRL